MNDRRRFLEDAADNEERSLPPQVGKLRRGELVQFLEEELQLKYNLVTNTIWSRGEPTPGSFLNTLYIQLDREFGVDALKAEAMDAAVLAARQNSYHPVRDYLDSLTTSLSEDEWDNLEWHCFGIRGATARLHLQRQLVAAVARAYSPGCQVDTCLILHSQSQGRGKSKFWATLFGEWFSESLGDLSCLKEDRLIVNSAWGHEWGEVDSVFRRRSSEKLKRFVSTSNDDVRFVWERGYTKLPRASVIVGTTNRDDFLRDPTGNRRFPCISVREVDLAWVQENRDRLWKRVREAYFNGFQWWYSREENEAISRDAEAFAPVDPVADAVADYLDRLKPTELQIPQVAWDVDATRWKDRLFAREIADHLKRFGWKRTVKKARGRVANTLTFPSTSFWIRADEDTEQGLQRLQQLIDNRSGNSSATHGQKGSG